MMREEKRRVIHKNKVKVHVITKMIMKNEVSRVVLGINNTNSGSN